MYKPPIELFYSDVMIKSLAESAEQTIIQAIQKVGVNVDKDELISALRYDRDQYERGAYDVLNVLSAAWHGKQYYFLQNDGTVYSRDSAKSMTVDDAVAEFANKIGEDGSV